MAESELQRPLNWKKMPVERLFLFIGQYEIQYGKHTLICSQK